jgi:amino acid transporter
MLSAYLFTAVAAVISAYIFTTNLLPVLGGSTSLYDAFVATFIALVWLCAYRDIRLSSRVGLVLEGLAVGVMAIVTTVLVWRHGRFFASEQLHWRSLHNGRIFPALTLAVFSFVGFESSATLAKEARNPQQAIPRAVILSATISGFFFVAMAYCMILGVDDRASLIAGSPSPFALVTRSAGLPSAALLIYFSAIISCFACALACINAVARMLFSMGRYQFLHRSLGKVHARHQSPHIAVNASCLFIVLIALMLSRNTPLDAFGYVATFSTFGFLVVYMLVCVVAPMELRRAGELSVGRLTIGALGLALMTFVVIANVFPAPPYPYSLLPFIFAAYLAFGCAWFALNPAALPAAQAGIQLDLEAD